MMDPDKYKLSPEELVENYKQISDDFLTNSPSLEDPNLGVIASQTGGGKSKIFLILKEELGPNGPVHADLDKTRKYNTHAKVIVANHPFDTAFYTNEDAWILTSRLLKDARDNRCNVLYETALKSLDGIEKVIEDFKNAGYAVDLHTLAVNSKHSIYGIFERFEDAFETNKFARFVAIEYHDNTYALLPVHVDHLEKSGSLNAVFVWKRAREETCKRVYVNDGSSPQKTAKLAIEEERARIWTAEEKKEFLAKWRKLMWRIKDRPEGDSKPRWYVEAASYFFKEAILFAQSNDATENETLDPEKIRSVTHHHVFTRSEKGAETLCFDRGNGECIIPATRGKVIAPPTKTP